jgi:hypothetical protein
VNLSNENALLILCARQGSYRDNPEKINSLLALQIKWDELLSAAVSQGIAPLVYKNLKDIPEKTSVPDEVIGKLRIVYQGNVARNMYLYSELERILQAFHEEKIDVITLKGAALAGTVYGDIGLRIMSDIDLLVRPECLARAKEVMSDLAYFAGGTKTEGWYKEKHFHLPPFIHKEKQIIVEIHWNVAGDSLGINVDRWWGRARKTRLGEGWVLIPSPEDMILHLCISLYHGNYNKAALRGLCDIFYTIRYFSEETDWKLFRELIEQSKIARPVYSILFLVRKYFDSSNQALSWLDHVHTDIKFTAMAEKIIFIPENEYYSLFMKSLAADTKWEKTKIIFADIFPSQEKMSKRYSIRADSAKVYIYYAYRPIELTVKYGRSLLKMFCFRNST